jgi:predicted dehydrogenase/DNA-binding NarL/FixJ family response regulator
MPLRVVLADDHVVVRQALKSLLEREGYQVAGEASDGQELVRMVSNLGPDVAIVDISMPVLNGLDAARELQRSSPKTKTILLTQHDEDQYVTEALRAGVKGYVLKSQAASDLVQAIHQVCRGGTYLMATQIQSIRHNYLSETTAELSKSLDCHARQSPGNLVRVGVIGYGYWGPNVVRNLQGLENCQLVAICDQNPAGLQRASKLYPGVDMKSDSSELLSSSEIDAIAVVTPVWTHFELAKSALQSGKHVFVEKPFTSTAQQAEELIELAERKRLKIAVDHTFLFTGAVKKMRQLVDDGILGELYYYDSTRVNLGLFQHDVNVVWDLAPHDLSIMDYIIQQKPKAVVATGGRHLNGVADMAFITVYFPGKLIAHINVNWLSPVKIRTTLLGGEKKMLVWNDLEADEKIKVYDKGVQMTNGQGIYDSLVSYRSGDVWTPKVEQTEALKIELGYFIDCILNDRTPLNDGLAGLRVVKMLEAADKSLKEGGKIIPL